MPELTVTVRVPVPKQPTLAALEKAIFKALMAAGRRLLVEAFGMLEERVLAGANQRRRRRYLITRFGEIRFTRWQTRTEEGYGYPLDRALQIRPRTPARPSFGQPPPGSPRPTPTARRRGVGGQVILSPRVR